MKRTTIKEGAVSSAVDQFLSRHSGVKDRSQFFRAAALILVNNPGLLSEEVLSQSRGGECGNPMMRSKRGQTKLLKSRAGR